MIRFLLPATVLLAALTLSSCNARPTSFSATSAGAENPVSSPDRPPSPSVPTPASDSAPATSFAGFDRNAYPGDDRLADLHAHFAFTGYWLNNPPGARSNSWAGHRKQLVDAGFGFLVLWNGRLDAEIRRAQTRDKLTPDALGRQDAKNAVAAAQHEGFPAGTIVFLDQEEGGRLLPEQSSYFFAFTEELAQSPYRPGAYLSGQPSDDGPGTDGKRIMITTAQDVRQAIAAKHLHPVALWVAQDACPPAPGCTVAPEALEHLHPTYSGTLDASVWQYAQSPQRPDLTRACAATYARDGNCYASATPDLPIDLDLANSADPSHGR